MTSRAFVATAPVTTPNDGTVTPPTTIGTRCRWYVKKVLRAGVALTGALLGRLGGRGGATPRVHVLTYHRFGDASYDPFCVRVADFEDQMRWIAASGLAVSLDDLLAFVHGERTLRDGSVLVTVDDGCPSFLSGALPVLRKYGVPVVAFVPAGEIAADGTVVDRGAPEHATDRVTRTQLADMERQGVVIGSHAWTHDSLGAMSLDEARTQVTRSRTALADYTGGRIDAFAYPYGTRADFNDDTARVVREAGYACAFTSQHGAIVPRSDPFALPRIKVEGGEGLAMFRRLAGGGLDGWRWIDRALWRVQASGR